MVDVIVVVLGIMTAGMGVMTFLQYKKTVARKNKFIQSPQPQPLPNPQGYTPQQLQPIQQPQQPAQSQNLQNIRQSNINRVANRNYKEAYKDLAQEMRENKQKEKLGKRTEINEQIKIHEMMRGAKHGKEFGRSVDVQNWERNNFWAINENKMPSEKTNFVEPKLAQQQYWNQNQALVWGVLGLSGFILFLILVM